ncbi:hypothetical protein [Oryzobacter telluris]|uniref:hypothetical protein n=1 Tax=Oryzobacter telluris TaxID=3149179 RepID=UPI00370D90D2
MSPRPPAVEARDQTARTIGIIALVVGGLALLAQVLMVVFPFLLIGGLMAGSEGDWVEEGPIPMSNSAFSGAATPASDGSMSGTALRDGLVAAGRTTGAIHRSPSSIECDDVRRVEADASVLCRGADGDRWYAVVRFTASSGSFDVTTMSDVEDEW